jgi:hypothetical protein
MYRFWRRYPLLNVPASPMQTQCGSWDEADGRKMKPVSGVGLATAEKEQADTSAPSTSSI